MLDMDRKQRRDIDTLEDDTLSLGIDDSNLLQYSHTLSLMENVEGNNWIITNDKIEKFNISQNDKIVFHIDDIEELKKKDIEKIVISYDAVASGNVYLNNITLDNGEVAHNLFCKRTINGTLHIDEDCNLFGFSNEELVFLSNGQGFDIVFNFDDVSLNQSIIFSNVEMEISFSDKFNEEQQAIVNRLVPKFDFYKEGTKLVIEIGDIEGQGGGSHSSGGSTIDAYTKDEINQMMAQKVDVIMGKGLSSTDFTSTEKEKLATIQPNANNYTHPSTHDSSIIIEESSLTNIGTSANSTQHEINLAIDDKINQGGGSGGSYINDFYGDSSTNELVIDYDTGVSQADIVSSWSNVTSDSNVPSEKLAKDTLDTKQDLLISGTTIKTINNQSLLGSGDIAIQGGGSSVDIVTSWESTLSDIKVASEKLVKDTIDTKANSSHTHTVSNITDFPTIPSKVSDLNNDGGFITSSSLPTKTSDLQNDGDGTNAFVKTNDSRLSDARTPVTHTHIKSQITDFPTLSTVATSGDYDDLSNKPTIPTVPSLISAFTNDVGYLTQHQSLTNYVQKSNTNGLIRNDGSIDTNTYLTQHQSLNGYLQTTDVVDNLTSTSTTAPLSANQGKQLKDLIGNAITVINGSGN